MLLSDPVDQCLAVGGIILHTQSQIFLHHLGEGLGNLVIIALVHRIIAFVCIRNGNLGLAEYDGCALCGKGISCGYGVQFGTDIACVEFRHLNGFGAFQHVQFI